MIKLTGFWVLGEISEISFLYEEHAFVLEFVQIDVETLNIR